MGTTEPREPVLLPADPPAEPDDPENADVGEDAPDLGGEG